MARVLGAVRDAWEGGDATHVQRLLSAGEDVNVCDETGHCASPLLPLCPDPHGLTDPTEKTPLAGAVRV